MAWWKRLPRRRRHYVREITIAIGVVMLCLLAAIVINTLLLTATTKSSLVRSLDTKIPAVDNTRSSPVSQTIRPIPVVVLVACGIRKLEVVSAIKAIILTADSDVDIHLFLERNAADRELVVKEVDRLRNIVNSIRIIYHDMRFPPSKGNTDWKWLFMPCASQRLFLPDILLNIDSVLYLDLDVLFLEPVSKLFNYFPKFNATQLVSVSPEDETTDHSFYHPNGDARHPYYGDMGLNSGVMLMNLTRMRSISFSSAMAPLLEQYRKKIHWGDQDLLNIHFALHPELVYVVPCRFNYRTDHYVDDKNTCSSAASGGIAALHGSRRVFTNLPDHVFGMVYSEFLHYDIINAGNPRKTVARSLRQQFAQAGYLNKQISLYALADIVLKGIESD